VISYAARFSLARGAFVETFEDVDVFAISAFVNFGLDPKIV